MREALKQGIKYELNEEIKKEFEEIKKEIMDSGFIYVQTDASKLGLGYVLYQIEGDTSKKGEKIMETDPAATEEEKEN